MTTQTERGPDIVLHIGTMKSGTSYIQAILRRNKRLLARDGIQVPRNMVPAVVDVLGRRGVAKEAEIEGAWERFQNLVESWSGRLVIASQEFMSGATAAEAATLVQTLPPGKVRVVITNRDLARVIPSHWQTVIKNGGTWPFPEYVRLLLERDTGDGSEHRYSRGFWRHHDLAAIVDNWASAVGLENVVLVTVPQSGAPSDLLWNRFAEAVGAEGSHYDIESDKKSNISLTYAETEMLREVNLRVRKPLTPLEYRILVNKYLANRLLRQAPDAARDPDRPRLGAESHTRTQERADVMLEAVAASGVRVIGDLEDLRVRPFDGDPEAVDSTGPQNPIPETVPKALAKLVLRVARLERDLDRTRKVLGAPGPANRSDTDAADDDATGATDVSSDSSTGTSARQSGGGGGRRGGGGQRRRGGRSGGGSGTGPGGGGGGKAGGGNRRQQGGKRNARADDDDSFEATAFEVDDLDDQLSDD